MKSLAVLQFVTREDFEANLSRLADLYQESGADLVLAPEVCLSGFCYSRMDEASQFGNKALKELLNIVGDRVLVLTVIEKRGKAFFNVAKVLHRGRIIHEQAKHKLFLLGDEHEHFRPGKAEDIAVFEIEGTKVALLICFELRFTHLWIQVQGAEIVLVPAMWGKNRAEHLAILSPALAVANRAYVMVADSANGEMAKESAIITPWGVRNADNSAEMIVQAYDPKEIKKIKRAIPYE